MPTAIVYEMYEGALDPGTEAEKALYETMVQLNTPGSEITDNADLRGEGGGLYVEIPAGLKNDFEAALQNGPLKDAAGIEWKDDGVSPHEPYGPPDVTPMKVPTPEPTGPNLPIPSPAPGPPAPTPSPPTAPPKLKWTIVVTSLGLGLVLLLWWREKKSEAKATITGL